MNVRTMTTHDGLGTESGSVSSFGGAGSAVGLSGCCAALWCARPARQRCRYSLRLSGLCSLRLRQEQTSSGRSALRILPFGSFSAFFQ